MLAAQRRGRILAELSRDGTVRVTDLVELLGVSDMTVRRDLVALHRDGLSATEVRERTGIAAGVVARYAAAFDEGRRERDFGRYVGKGLSALDRCRLLGTWEAVYGA